MNVTARDFLMIDQPLVLVSEIQRSGGSLMGQLFDGHPELFAHPGEIQIGGGADKLAWPELDLQAKPETWLAQLHEPHTDTYIKHGFQKPGQNKFAADESFPFRFDKKLQKRIFLDAVGRGATTQRQVLNAYFTSYFAALGDHAASGREKFVAGFTPRVNMVEKHRAGFFRDYPDGRMISLVRDPRSWWASTKSHNPERKRELGEALALWQASSAAVGELMRDRAGSFLPLIFEAIVGNPEPEMRKVARFLGIEFHPALLEPTYLGTPVLPNSTFQVKNKGIDKGAGARHAHLEPAELAVIEREALPHYRRLCDEAERFAEQHLPV
jgi:hypothetical protein